MIKIFTFIFGVIFLGVIIILAAGSVSESNADVDIVLYILYAGGMMIWLACVVSDVLSVIKNQYKDFYSLDDYDRQKESYNTEMEQYIAATKNELLNNFRNFEESLMNKVSDSKLIATVLQENGYAKALSIYESRIKGYLHDIHQCDRWKEKSKKDMLIRQSDYISGYAFIIPSNIKIFK
jgi:hypothetical protein